jgi:hypothetical protein
MVLYYIIHLELTAIFDIQQGDLMTIQNYPD